MIDYKTIKLVIPAQAGIQPLIGSAQRAKAC